MKRFLIFIWLLPLFITPAFGAGVKHFSVLPFSVHGPSEYRYLSQGIQSMFVSRLSSPQVLESVEVNTKGKNISKSDIITQNNLDYLIWGDVTIFKDTLSIDTKVLDRKGKVFSKSLVTSQDKLMQDFDNYVEEIKDHLLGIKPKIKSPTQVGISTNNKNLPGRGLNPYFEYSTSSSMSGGVIRTQTLPFELVGLAIGDGNGDGKNEVFLLSHHQVYAYILIQNKLKLLSTYDIGRNKKGLNINVFDSNRDGYAEIYISAVDNENVPCSCILTFKHNKFQVVQDRLKFYINVKRLPPDYSRRIVGQKTGVGRLFGTGIHEVVNMNGKYVLGPRINLPDGSNVFNFAYLPEKNGYKIITTDSYDHLKVFSDDLSILYKTTKVYAGSSISLEGSNGLPGLGESRTDPNPVYYIPTRLLPCDLDRDGRFELIVAHNISLSSMFFSRYREFPEGQIHALYWDGVGLNLEWKTKTIKGSIMDYGIGDINNDSKDELFVGINTYPGPIGWKKKKTIVLIYPLNIKKK